MRMLLILEWNFVMGKKVVYYHRIESDFFWNLEMLIKTEKMKVKIWV